MEYRASGCVCQSKRRDKRKHPAMTLLRRLRIATMTCLVAAAFVATDITASDQLRGVTVAYADDDGGGGRGGGRSNRSAKRGGDDGPTLIRRWRTRKASVRRPRPAVVEAMYEPNTLIARDLSDATIATLGARGFRVIERHALAGGSVLVKLGIPAAPRLPRPVARSGRRTLRPSSISTIITDPRAIAASAGAASCAMSPAGGVA